jgi:glutamate formiminotransferase
VPNFSEGRRPPTIDSIRAAAVSGGAVVLDADADADHNRLVLSLVSAAEERLLDSLVAAVAAAIESIDVGTHSGVHPRVGAADVVPVVPLGDVRLSACAELARQLGERIWSDLGAPVYLYGAASRSEPRTLAAIRAGRIELDFGRELHPTAGAVCVGARPPLVAYNIILPGADVAAARTLARQVRESSGGLAGVQALAFRLSDDAVQLSMNLIDLQRASPATVYAEVARLARALQLEPGPDEVVGLCPAVAANVDAASGNVLEARIAAAAARRFGGWCVASGDRERSRLGTGLLAEAEKLALVPARQETFLAAAEECLAMTRLLAPTGYTDPEVEAMLSVAARGFEVALLPETRQRHQRRVAYLGKSDA